MWEKDTHGAAIKDALDKSTATLGRHTNERGDTGHIADIAQVSRLGQAKPAMLEVDKKAVKVCVACDLHHQGVRRDLDAK